MIKPKNTRWVLLLLSVLAANLSIAHAPDQGNVFLQVEGKLERFVSSNGLCIKHQGSAFLRKSAAQGV